MKLISVGVLLSTYNGEKYIREQIESILNQKNVDIRLFVRDDGSTDSTLDALREYQNLYPNIVVFAEQNIGCKKSFYTLLKYAYEFPIQCDYYAFADQDDLWLKDKLEIAVKRLEKSNKNPKRFYYSNFTSVDASLNILPSEKSFLNADLNSVIISCHILGCTMVFSYNLLEMAKNAYQIIINKSNIEIPYHDVFLANLAFILDSFIERDEESHIFYRQHGDNLVGSSRKSLFKTLAERIKSNSSRFMTLQLVCNVIEENQISYENKDLINTCINYKKSFSNRIKLLFDKRLHSPSLTHNLFFRLFVMLGKW